MTIEQLEHRVARFTNGLTRCSAEVLMYGKCVASKNNLKKDDCLKEFRSLHKCVMAMMKK
uniref:IMS import disulfide relay-system CHCH-CHCH-like Cx9C domain-containing protein n=1 Tax=Octopus bimaculoides TaxID=37653 RepID=A0A0L8I1S2_OCTBM